MRKGKCLNDKEERKQERTQKKRDEAQKQDPMQRANSAVSAQLTMWSRSQTKMTRKDQWQAHDNNCKLPMLRDRGQSENYICKGRRGAIENNCNSLRLRMHVKRKRREMKREKRENRKWQTKRNSYIIHELSQRDAN